MVWSCWRLNCASPEATTVGTVTAKRNADRPPLGSVESCSELMTAPVDAVDVSMSGASPVTVIVSCRAPTSSVMSMRHELLGADANALLLVGLEARERRLDRVVPGGNRGEVVRALLVRDGLTRGVVASLINCTVTPGMTPLASFTVPRRPPVKVCANAVLVASGTISSANSAHRVKKFLISRFLQID